MTELEKIRTSFKRYIKDIYFSHREADEENMEQLISAICRYIDIYFEEHKKELHSSDIDLLMNSLNKYIDIRFDEFMKKE